MVRKSIRSRPMNPDSATPAGVARGIVDALGVDIIANSFIQKNAKLSRRKKNKSVSLQRGLSQSTPKHPVFAPVSMDYDRDVNISFSIKGNAQRNTDVGSYIDCVRVVGTDLPFSIEPNTSNAQVLGNIYTSTGGFYLPIVPSALSNRLKLFEEMYQYYAFRTLKITYIPAVGTSTAGSFALAVCNNQSITSADFNSIQDCLQYPVRFLSPYWDTRSMVYKFNGTQVWTAHTDVGTDTDQTTQAVIGGVGNANGNTNGQINGYLYIEYVIDFYGSMAIDSGVAYTLVRKNKHKESKIDESKSDLQHDDCEERKLNDVKGLEPLPLIRSSLPPLVAPPVTISSAALAAGRNWQQVAPRS